MQRCGRHTRAKLLAYGGWVGLCAGSLTWLICGHFGSSFPVFQNPPTHPCFGFMFCIIVQAPFCMSMADVGPFMR